MRLNQLLPQRKERVKQTDRTEGQIMQGQTTKEAHTQYEGSDQVHVIRVLSAMVTLWWCRGTIHREKGSQVAYRKI